jgi:pullulanase
MKTTQIILTLNGGFIDGKDLITLYFKESLKTIPAIKDFHLKNSDDKIILIKKIFRGSNANELCVFTDEEIDIKKEYFMTFGEETKRLVLNDIFLNQKYYDLKIELGAICNKKSTIFRLFAPRASFVKLRIYQNPVRTEDEKIEEYQLSEKKGGIWEVNIKKDLHGKYYTYQLKSVGNDCNPKLEVIDPYAKLVTKADGINIIRKNSSQPFDQTLGRAMIIDFERTNKTVPLKSSSKKIGESIIWETHIRDLTRGINSGIPDDLKGTYLGAAYKGSKYKGYTTGFDHIVELGVNTVHLLPVHEFVTGNEYDYKHKYIGYDDQSEWPEKRYYDWGYGPVYYFSPEGYYASNTNDLSRINEFKDMISEFHKNGIKVVIDVVFNHTFEGSRNSPNIYSFRGIDADYYYRSLPDGTFLDGISCQNEVKTENPMVAKLLLDCLIYWTKEFKIDGFRFDWMSAYDPKHMAEMITKLRKINPDVLLYGELWTLRGLTYKAKSSGTYLDRQHIGLFEKDYKLPAGSIAGFNDYFRDAVKGSGFMREYAGGYIQNTVNEKYYPASETGHKPYELVKKVIKGMVDYKSLENDPTEWQDIESPLNSINYIDCHDGYTLFDKLIISDYCKYVQPGKSTSPKPGLPRSEKNSNVVNFNDESQFDKKESRDNLIKMNNLGAAILLTSQGIPFMHAGQEILRQKINYVKDDATGKYFYIFDSNSNTSSDETNSIKWENKEKNIAVFNYYKGLIKLRKEHPTFRRITKSSVNEGLIFHDEWLPKDGDRCIAYNLIDPKNKLESEKWKNVIILMNPYPEKKSFSIPDGEWAVVVSGNKSGTEVLSKISNTKLEVEGISIVVMYRL